MSRSSRFYLVAPLVLLLVIVVGVGVALIGRSAERNRLSAGATTTPSPFTEPNPGFTALAGNDPIGADFATFYEAQGRAALLGKPIMPELPDEQNITQLCQNGMLGFTLGKNATVTLQPLISGLIAAQANIPLAQGGALTYAGLAPAADPSAQVPAPATWQPGGKPQDVGIFVSLGMRNGVVVGHYIPPDFAAYLVAYGNENEIAGVPLTEVLQVPLGGGQTARVQAFTNLVLVEQPDANGAAAITPRALGSDWLSIFGRPELNILPQTTIHVTKGLSIQANPGGANVATFSTPFAATLIGDALWQGTTLWYHVGWHNLLEQRTGWLPADVVAFSAATFTGVEMADAEALSPHLAKYLSGLGDDAAVAVYVPSQHRMYGFNDSLALEMASVVKIPILMTLLAQAEAAGRSLTSDEQAEAASMIEYSDNDAAQALYDEEGGNPALESYMSSIGITDFGLTLNGFGTSTISPRSMNLLLEDLRTASVLTPGDCQYVLYLMSQVTADERIGLGDTAPNSATVQLKDGYGVEDDGLYVTNTSGILTYHGQVYDVTVFTRRENTQQQGFDEVNTICKDVALALVGQP